MLQRSGFEIKTAVRSLPDFFKAEFLYQKCHYQKVLISFILDGKKMRIPEVED